jgi:predicted unusual protein kinase regulating ubiquinone biosynthesis (AarF/ABC1/UbiB family)
MLASSLVKKNIKVDASAPERIPIRTKVVVMGAAPPRRGRRLAIAAAFYLIAIYCPGGLGRRRRVLPPSWLFASGFASIRSFAPPPTARTLLNGEQLPFRPRSGAWGEQDDRIRREPSRILLRSSQESRIPSCRQQRHPLFRLRRTSDGAPKRESRIEQRTLLLLRQDSAKPSSVPAALQLFARCALACAALLVVLPRMAGAVSGGGSKHVWRALRHPQVTALVLVALHSTRDLATRRVLPYLSTSLRAVRFRHVVAASLLWLTVLSTVELVQVRRRQAADATSEWSRYAQRPGARGRAAMALLLQILPLYLSSKLPLLRQTHRHRLLQTSGRAFADGLLKLGPLYIKLGQIVSCRDKLLPKEWKVALERLQDQVPSRKGQDALDLAYAAWPSGKRNFHSVFSDFETTPLAAASLGQVHRATLASTGAKVAIKLQRPYLRQIYDQDLALMTKIAAFADRFGGSAAELGGISQSWVEIFRDAEAILYREIDYRDEARHILRFCNDFGLALGGKEATNVTAVSRNGVPLPSAAPWLRTPIVYESLSSEKVLVMEYVSSIKITNRDSLEVANVTSDDMEYLADMLARSYLRQFCCNLFFSTDPHPGNLGVEILQPNAPLPKDRVRLVYYDFGQAATLNKNQADGILTIIEAIVDSDVDRSMEAFQQMGVLKEGADLAKVRAKIADNYKTGKVKANRKRLKKKGYVFRDAPQSAATNLSATDPASASAADTEVVQYFTLPAEYAFVGRALSQMDGVGKFLDPDFDFVSSAAPWIYEIKGAAKYLKEEAIKKWNKFVKDSPLGRILPTFVVPST